MEAYRQLQFANIDGEYVLVNSGSYCFNLHSLYPFTFCFSEDCSLCLIKNGFKNTMKNGNIFVQTGRIMFLGDEYAV